MTTLRSKKGVSLVELIAVIVIMGIIATVGGISVASIIENSNKSAAQSAVSDVLSAGKNYLQSDQGEAIKVSLKALVEAGDIEAATAGKFTDTSKVVVYEFKSATAGIIYIISDSTTEPTVTSTEGTVAVKGGYTVTYTVATGKFTAVKS